MYPDRTTAWEGDGEEAEGAYTQDEVRDKKMNTDVQHHEIKFHESRFKGDKGAGPRAEMRYYCVCGDWSGKVPHLRQAEIVDEFIEDHLRLGNARHHDDQGT